MEKESNKLFEMFLEDDNEDGLYALSMVDKPAMKATWVTLKEEHKIVLFKTVSEDKRVVLGAALIPEMPVYRDWYTPDGEKGLDIFFSEDTIRKSHELVMRKGLNTFTMGHGKTVPNVHLLEIWMIEDPEKDKQAVYGLSHPKGTMMVGLKINNDEVWTDYIKTGDLNGFSIEGLFKMADKPTGTLTDDEFITAVKSALSVT